jgi:hypothetical protein
MDIVEKCLTAVVMKIDIYWDMKPCTDVSEERIAFTFRVRADAASPVSVK